MREMQIARIFRVPLQAVQEWFRSWRTAQSQFDSCSDEDIAQMAHELGASTAELRELARRSPHGADLLLKRMAALDLDQNEVVRREPATLQDLQRVCSFCDCHGRCARDLARDPLDPRWKDYCPNAHTLTALAAEPGTVRKEW